MSRGNTAKWISCIIFIVLAAVSVFLISPALSSPEAHGKEIAYLDQKKTVATGLSASAASLSVLITVAQDDIGTPIASEIADLATDFLVVLGALTTEKYLLTISAYVVFTWIVPFSLLLMALNVFVNSLSLWKFLAKTLLFCAVLMLFVPTSIRLSSLIDDTYQESVAVAAGTAQELENELHLGIGEAESRTGEMPETEDLPENESVPETETAGEDDAQNPFLGWIGSAGEAIGGAAGAAADGVSGAVDAAVNAIKSIPELPGKAAAVMNRLLEAFVIMIVTTCVIPILTLLGMFWFANGIVGTHLSLEPVHRFYRGSRRRREEREVE